MEALDDEEFREKMEEFPSLFSMKLSKVTKEKLKSVKFNLLGDIKCGFKFPAEEVQAYNLLSYLSFQVEEHDDATVYNKRAIEKDPNSANALAIRAWMNWKDYNFFDADEDVRKLKSLYGKQKQRNRMDVQLIVHAEIAFAYARFGPKYHNTAISLYEQVFGKNTRAFGEAYFMWRYDYGLTLRRTLHFGHFVYKDVNIAERTKRAVGVFADIISRSRQPRYIARAFIELGELAYLIEKRPETYPGGIWTYFPEYLQEDTSLAYFERAIEIDGGDFDVLCVSSKFFRYFNKLSEAIDLSEAGLKLRETSKLHHHHALSLRKMETNAAYRMKNRHVGNRETRRTYNDFKDRSPAAKEKNNITKMIKSHKVAPRIQANGRTQKVIFHLDKAIEIDRENVWALYDKAYTLRRLGKVDEAISILCRCTSMLDNCELKVSCFEQAGYCCLDLAQDSPDERHKYNAVKYFQRAIELCAALASLSKYTAEVRCLIPTVKDLLSRPEQWETRGNELGVLSELLKKFAGVLPIFDDVISTIDTSSTSLRDHYRKDKEYDKAALLAVLRRLAGTSDEEDLESDIETILEAAADSLLNGQEEEAKSRYQDCFEALSFRKFKTRRDLDVLFASDEESENLQVVRLFSSLLNRYAGLSVANNFDDFPPNQPKLHTFEVCSEASTAIAFVFNTSDLDHLIGSVITMILSQEPQDRPFLLIMKQRDIKMPLKWSNVPTIEIPEKTDDVQSINCWIQTFLLATMCN